MSRRVDATDEDARRSAASSMARVDELERAALAAARDAEISAAERAEMLVEVAMRLQLRPSAPESLEAAIRLYERATALCPFEDELLRARIIARKGTALQALPRGGWDSLEEAREAYEKSLPDLRRLGGEEEAAEAEMNMALVTQQLAAAGRARLPDAIAGYQRALRTFTSQSHPVEFAILQSNLATAFLSIPVADERAGVREALAVQCFEEALRAVNLIEHPVEYAMLQNNLGNALQYASSSHPLENCLRALAAYDEALKVRTRANGPLEYANTIANKANCLWSLPDDPERPESGNLRNMRLAKALYKEAIELFAAHGEEEKCGLVSGALEQLTREMAERTRP